MADSITKKIYLIERNDSVQIEKDVQRKETSTFKIHWLSDCEYQLNILDGPNEIMDFYKHRTLTVKIIETYADGYKFEASASGYNFKYLKTVKFYDKVDGEFNLVR